MHSNLVFTLHSIHQISACYYQLIVLLARLLSIDYSPCLWYLDWENEQIIKNVHSVYEEKSKPELT